MVVVLAPVVEELFYRGLVLRAFERRLGPAPALWLTALWFAAAHFQGIQFPILLGVGLVTGLMTQWTGRLGPAIAAHVAFNALTVAVLL
jgi:membrane protease YdiL (CAAX protease family)